MAVPGGPGAYVSTGIEHDEAGNPHYEPELHTAMMAKRFRKLQPLADHEGRVTITGPEQADVGILGWGSTEGAALEAAEICLDRGPEGLDVLPARAGAAAERAHPRSGRTAWAA